MQKLTKGKISIIIAVFIACLIGMFTLHPVKGNTTTEITLHIMSGSLVYFLIKTIMSFFYRPSEAEVPKRAKVSIITPSYNEDPESVIKSIYALIGQTYPIHEIIFVDDGSSDPTAYLKVSEYAEGYNKKSKRTKIITHRFNKNKGKRAAMEWGFKKSTGDYLMIYDSDGTISPGTVKELLRPFADEKVYAVCGHINARNVDHGIFTRLQDLMYQGAFRTGRAASSLTGDVVVCSGACSMFRRKPVVENLHLFTDQTFMGIKLASGDDRRLTQIMLMLGGKVKYQSTAICLTDVPVTLKKFFIQQVRWSKSFYIGTFTTIPFAWKRPMLLFWILGEGFLWAIFGVTMAYNLITTPIGFGYIYLIYTLAYFAITVLSRNLYYIFKNPLLFLGAPFFSIIRMLLIFPIRIYALLTLRVTKWGTR